MTLKEFNNLEKNEAVNTLTKCCVSKTWVNYMIKNMPFDSANKLVEKAGDIWYEQCKKLDWYAAFEGHPKIGNINSLKSKFVNTKSLAQNEQAKIADADKKLLKNLAKANEDYFKKFGYIFIISASGKSATEILNIINLRLNNSGDEELEIAMGEQHKITLIRLTKLIDVLPKNINLQSHITTHVLDTSTGIPGKGMPIVLQKFVGDKFKIITIGITNSDGRISDLLPPGIKLKPGNYKMIFNTETYYKNCRVKGFYPKVIIHFLVSNHSHYHIPLLINPYGYTTYKGS